MISGRQLPFETGEQDEPPRSRHENRLRPDGGSIESGKSSRQFDSLTKGKSNHVRPRTGVPAGDHACS